MQSVITFVQAHQVVLAAGGIAFLDFLFAVNPSWKSSGVLHWVYIALGGKAE